MINRKILLLISFFLIFSLVFYFKFSINDSSNGVSGYVSLGNEMGIVGNHLKASSAFKNALNLDPYHTPAYLGLGTAYGNMGRYKEAVQVLKEGIKIDPSHNLVPQMQMSIGLIAYNNMNDNETAVKYVKMALQSFTDQGNLAGVALVAQKLKQINTVP